MNTHSILQIARINDIIAGLLSRADFEPGELDPWA